MRASRLSPAEAMRVVSSGELEPSNRFLAYLGAFLSTGGFAVLLLCIAGTIHINHAITGCVFFLLGGIVALPTFLAQATQLVLRCLGGLLGVEGRLAQRQLLRNRGRSSLTIGILFIALSTGLGMACTILDNIRNVRVWSEEALLGDFFVRATMPSMATGQAADMPAGLVGKIASLEGVRSVETLRFVSGRASDYAVVIVAREFSTRGRKFFDIVHGTPEGIFEGIEQGNVAIGSVLAERAKLKLGDELTIETQEGPVTRSIVGIVNDYVAAGLTVYMSRTQAEALLKVEGNDAIIIDIEPGKADLVEASLRPLCDQDGLLLQSQADLLKLVRAKVDGVVSGLWAVLALGSLIAAFGLVNTLAMNILEQTAEIGMLRIVAMTRGQVRKLILSQAILMGLVGLIPAVFSGLFIAYLLSLSLLPTTGHSVAFVFRPWLTIGTFFAELAVVIVASLLPAERAARIAISKAMQFQ
jgi:putative ABC transport system permease protein